MPSGKRQVPVDQVTLVLDALSNPRERSELLFDPQTYASRRGIKLDPQFIDAIKNEVGKVNQRILALEENSGISLPRIDDPRSRNIIPPPGEVALLPVILLAAEAVEVASLLVVVAVKIAERLPFMLE